MPAPLTIRLHPADNVVVARMDILPGTAIEEDVAAATRVASHQGGKMAATAPSAAGDAAARAAASDTPPIASAGSRERNGMRVRASFMPAFNRKIPNDR